MANKYIIEARNPDGSLSMAAPQPEEFFGIGAIQGMDEDSIAKVIFKLVPDASLSGPKFHLWAEYIDSRFKIRLKYW